MFLILALDLEESQYGNKLSSYVYSLLILY